MQFGLHSTGKIIWRFEKKSINR